MSQKKKITNTKKGLPLLILSEENASKHQMRNGSFTNQVCPKICTSRDLQSDPISEKREPMPTIYSSTCKKNLEGENNNKTQSDLH